MQTLIYVCKHFFVPAFQSGMAGKASLIAMHTIDHPKPSRPIRPAANRTNPNRWEEGALKSFSPKPGSQTKAPSQLYGGGGQPYVPPISRPDPERIAMAVAPIMRGDSSARIKALDEIARLSGQRPESWVKPVFGDFDYWLGHKCGWISDAELEQDTASYQLKRKRALESSHRFSQQRFSWLETPRFEEPADNGEYVPEISMKLVKDRNLTDSARRIALFVLRHTYQDNRSGRFIGMTVSFIMKGLSLSRRTVQRSLTLLETRSYFRCEVAKGDATKMCIGLIIHLRESLFPQHRKEKWPEKRRNPEAPTLPHKQNQFYKTLYSAKNKVSRLTWALKCMNGVARKAFQGDPMFGSAAIPSCRGFKTIGSGFLHPAIRTMAISSRQLQPS